MACDGTAKDESAKGHQRNQKFNLAARRTSRIWGMFGLMTLPILFHFAG